MSGTAKRLGRLLAIRKLEDDVGRRAFEQALASLAEAEAESQRQELELSEFRKQGRAALVEGNRPEWLMADAQAEVAGWNRTRLAQLLAARTEASADAERKYLESRSEHEQVKQLMDDAQRFQKVREERRAQVSADDWFLSKRNRSID